MSNIRKGDVKNHLSPRYRTQIHLHQTESLPCLTRWSHDVAWSCRKVRYKVSPALLRKWCESTFVGRCEIRGRAKSQTVTRSYLLTPIVDSAGSGEISKGFLVIDSRLGGRRDCSSKTPIAAEILNGIALKVPTAMPTFVG